MRKENNMIHGYEKEIKIFNFDLKDIGERLINLSPDITDSLIQKVTIYKVNDMTLKFVNSYSLKTRERTFFFYKKKKVMGSSDEPYKVRNEFCKVSTELELLHLKAMFDDLLEIKPTLNGANRERKYFVKNGFTFVIDIWDENIFPKPYMEIETIETNKDLREGIKMIFTPEEITNLTFSDRGISTLVKEYRNSISMKNYYGG